MKEIIIALVHAGIDPKKDIQKIPGVSVIDVPVSEIEYFDIYEALDKELNYEDIPDYIIFSSANSVKALLYSCHSQAMADKVRSIPAVVVGTKTRDAAQSAGFIIAGVAKESSQEGLAGFFTGMEHKTKKILFPSSALARRHLAVELTNLGFTVLQPEVYTAVPLGRAAFTPTARLLAAQFPSIVLFTSPSSFTYFKDIADESLLHIPLGAIGKTTALTIEQAGYRPGIISPKQDINEFIRHAASYIRAQREYQGR